MQKDNHKNRTKLYKFYSLARFAHLTIENLRCHKIYAQALGNLNDPFEGWWYQGDTENISSAHNREFRARLERCGIYSLCCSSIKDYPATTESILLWSHYADSHRGFCVEFTDDIKEAKDIEFTPSMVNYVDSLPDKDSLNSYDKKSIKDKERILYWKGKIWAYENELRLCFSGANKFHEIPQGCIKKIYCGCKMSDAEIAILQNIAKDLKADCLVLKRANDNYGFEIKHKSDAYESQD